MIDTVKLALRLKTTAFDAEVRGLIAAAYADLRLAGVRIAAGPLVEQAVVLYCKAHFGYHADAERLEAAYQNQKALLVLGASLDGGAAYALE